MVVLRYLGWLRTNKLSFVNLKYLVKKMKRAQGRVGNETYTTSTLRGLSQLGSEPKSTPKGCKSVEGENASVRR